MSSRIRAWTSSFFPRIFFKWALFKTLCRPFALIGWSGFPWWIVIFAITLVSIIHEIPYNHQPNAGFWTLLKYFAILDLASFICRLFAAINSLVLYWLRSFALKYICDLVVGAYSGIKLQVSWQEKKGVAFCALPKTNKHKQKHVFFIGIVFSMLLRFDVGFWFCLCWHLFSSFLSYYVTFPLLLAQWAYWKLTYLPGICSTLG